MTNIDRLILETENTNIDWMISNITEKQLRDIIESIKDTITEEKPDFFRQDENTIINSLKSMKKINVDEPCRKYYELKLKRTQDTQNIQVQVQDNIFAGDEESQGRLARAISVLQEGESTIWITENNGAQEVQREDLQEALKLAGEEQTKIWVQYNTSKEEL